LFGLIRLGLPFASQQVLHVGIAIVAIAVFATKSPFSRLTKVLFTFGYFMAFEYAVVSRNYVLSALLLFLIASSDRTRLDRPIRYGCLVALLANTNTHSLCIAAVIGGVYLGELIVTRQVNRRRMAAVAVMTMGGLAALATIWPAADTIVVHDPASDAPLRAIRQALIPGFAFSSWFFTAVALVTVALCLVALRRHLRSLVIIVGSLTGLSAIFLFKHSGQLRHYGLILLVLLAALWIAYRESEGQTRTDNGGVLSRAFGAATLTRAQNLIAVGLFLSIDSMFGIAELEILLPFSGAPEAGRFLAENIEEGDLVVAHESALAVGIAPHIDRKLWFPDVQDYGSYGIWNLEYLQNAELSEARIFQRIEAQLADGQAYWLISSRPLRDPAGRGLELVFETTTEVFGVRDEIFFIYR
jgi:hypothetical protein